MQKTICQKVSREYLFSLEKSVQSSLVAKGYLYNRSRAEITDTFVPWLAEAVAERGTAEKFLKTAIIDSIIKCALLENAKMQQEESSQANKKREEIRALEKLRSLVINFHLR